MKQVLLYLFVSAIILLLFSGTTSPLYHYSFSDGMVFQYVAMGIQHGQIPYIDIFDHKGPFTYFINYVGLLLGGRYGILFLQWINLSLVLYLFRRIYDSLNLGHGFNIVLFAILLCLILRIDDGGMTEEWSLLFITVSLSFFIKSFSLSQHQMPYWQMFVLGVSSGLVALLRLNNTAPILGLFLLWFALLINSKQYVYLLKSCMLCLIGFCIPIAISCGWFYAKAGFVGIKELYYGNIGFNLDYMQTPWPFCAPLWKILPVQFFYLLVITIALLSCYKKQGPHRLLILGLLFSIAMTLVTMGKSLFSHYQLILIPSLFVSLSLLYHYKKWIAFSLVIASGLFCLKYPLYRMKEELRSNSYSAQLLEQEFAQNLQVIPVSERSDSWNLNVDGSIDLFILNELFPQSRFCIPWHRGYTHRFREEEADAFRHQASRWVFVDEVHLYDHADDAAYLLQHYHKVNSTHTSAEKIISIYRLNE